MTDSSRKHKFRQFASWALIGLSIMLLVSTLTLTRDPGDSDSAAKKVEKIVVRQVRDLNDYMLEALHSDHSKWMNCQGLPEDMVIYRYVADTLQSWNHQFPIVNDDISSKVFVQVLSNPRIELTSPLSDVTENISFINLGHKYYLTKYVSEEDCIVIGGLEISDSNPKFKLRGKFSIGTLDESCGSVVYVEGKPQFKIFHETLRNTAVTNSYLVWVALLAFIAGMIVLLLDKRSIRCYRLVMAALLAALSAMYLWGINVQADVRLFSPTLYADGPVLYSLGALLIINLTLTLSVLCIYIVRREVLRWMSKRNIRLGLAVSAVAIFIFISGILFYTQFAFRSIIVNSNISLELYKLGEINIYTGIVYLSFIVMLMTIPMLIQMQIPALRTFTDFKIDLSSNKAIALFSILIAIYLVILSSVFGFRKEKARVEVWANMLSIERDITLELELRSVENSIAEDIFIGSLSVLGNGGSTILNRVVDNYLYSASRDNNISVFLLNDDTSNPQTVAYYNERVESGSPIAPSSRFIYTVSSNGRIRYTGVFVYFNPDYGVTHLLVEVEPKAGQGLRGGTVPNLYSYAKYNGRAISFFRGSYPYPTRMDDSRYSQVYENAYSQIVVDRYLNFVNITSEEEAVVITRRTISAFQYLLAIVFIALLSFLSLSLMMLRTRKRHEKEKGYYKSRVASVLTISLVATLVTMSSVSILFVYKRYQANKESVMSERVTSIQALVENFTRQMGSIQELSNQEGAAMLRSVSELSSSEVTLYSASGAIMITSNNDLIESLSDANRVEEEAYENIIYKHRRYFIKHGSGNNVGHYDLYAPVFNEEGSMLAIMRSPYSEESFDFEMEAVLHLVSILTVFIILLILARFMILAIVDRMFKPLSEMGRKMSAANVDELEYIEYDREDEIASLVKEYNRMVTDLSDSSKKLAQAERDKAWSAMARQVAHEIKNPLTPMKLQLQRIIRLKAKDAPEWQQKFDEASKVILDHIDILTDTANEFSTFAKLYTEEAIRFDVDAVLKEEIAMFDNHSNIEISYAGLDGATIVGPKPQLTRVFVNLINNAVQAVEDKEDGRIFVALRSSVKEGCYDIVFEDNGPGVPEDLQNRLFTPNFTTKSSGTGLGLAISRSILDRCSAEISYSKSFSLGGACFTISIPIQSISAVQISE